MDLLSVEVNIAGMGRAASDRNEDGLEDLMTPGNDLCKMVLSTDEGVGFDKGEDGGVVGLGQDRLVVVDAPVRHPPLAQRALRLGFLFNEERTCPVDGSDNDALVAFLAAGHLKVGLPVPPERSWSGGSSCKRIDRTPCRFDHLRAKTELF